VGGHRCMVKIAPTHFFSIVGSTHRSLLGPTMNEEKRVYTTFFLKKVISTKK
jgi:hypothetical protein